MSAIAVRFELVAMGPAGGVLIQSATIVLDCWRAQVFIGTQSPSNGLSLNGAPLVKQLFSAFGPDNPIVLEYGGMMDKYGNPVNLNTRLVFTVDPPRFNNILVVKEYLDPSLTDPMQP